MRRLAVLCAVVLAVLCWAPTAQADSPLSEPTCTLTARFTAASASTILVNHDGQHSIRICHYSISLALNATSSAQIVFGTGTTCGTSKVSVSPLLQIGTTVTGSNNALTAGNGWGFVDENPTRGVSDLCVVLSGATVAASGIVRYALL